MNSRPQLLALSLALAALLVTAAPAAAGSKYGTPRSGTWKVEENFGSTKGGTMKLSAKKKITKLVALPSDEKAAACGKRVELLASPQLKSYKQFSERWALAGVRGGLFVPRSARFKVDGVTVAGKVKILFNSPVLGTPAEFSFRDCDLRFTLRK